METSIRSLGGGILLLTAVTGGVLLQGHWSEIGNYLKGLLPVRHVRIEGRFRYLGREEVKQALLPVVKTDFITADMSAVDRAAEAMPWVAAAEAKRVWPDTIDVRIEEQAPMVRWGDKSLLNDRGEPFSPPIRGELLQLPLLTGPRGFERRLLEMMLGLQRSLGERGLELRQFHVTDRRSWKLILSNGMEIELGRQKPLKNFQRFLEVLPVLGPEKIAGIAKLDMRYPNGFAVLWKQGFKVAWPVAEVKSNHSEALAEAPSSGKAKGRKIEH